MPISFFFVTGRLVGYYAAAVATAVLVLVNGAAMPSWMTATYIPWWYSPALAIPIFLFGVALIQARAQQPRAINFILIGCSIGITFLAHPVPAVALGVIAICTTVLVRRFTSQISIFIAPLIVAAGICAAPFLLPLAATYQLKTLNYLPSTRADPQFLCPIKRSFAVSLMPGIIAIGVLFLLRNRLQLLRVVLTIVATWVIVPTLFLTRHFACGPAATSAICLIFSAPIHHWFIYLSSGLAVLVGLAFVLLSQSMQHKFTGIDSYITGTKLILLAAGTVLIFMRSNDEFMRRRALDKLGDMAAFEWIRQHTGPRELFVADFEDRDFTQPTTLAILATGRRLVAPPQVFSSPYLDWEAMNSLRHNYFDSATADSSDDRRKICTLETDNGVGHSSYFALSRTSNVTNKILVHVFTTSVTNILMVDAGACQAGSQPNGRASSSAP